MFDRRTTAALDGRMKKKRISKRIKILENKYHVLFRYVPSSDLTAKRNLISENVLLNVRLTSSNGSSGVGTRPTRGVTPQTKRNVIYRGERSVHGGDSSV